MTDARGKTPEGATKIVVPLLRDHLVNFFRWEQVPPGDRLTFKSMYTISLIDIASHFHNRHHNYTYDDTLKLRIPNEEENRRKKPTEFILTVIPYPRKKNIFGITRVQSNPTVYPAEINTKDVATIHVENTGSDYILVINFLVPRSELPLVAKHYLEWFRDDLTLDSRWDRQRGLESLAQPVYNMHRMEKALENKGVPHEVAHAQAVKQFMPDWIRMFLRPDSEGGSAADRKRAYKAITLTRLALLGTMEKMGGGRKTRRRKGKKSRRSRTLKRV